MPIKHPVDFGTKYTEDHTKLNQFIQRLNPGARLTIESAGRGRSARWVLYRPGYTKYASVYLQNVIATAVLDRLYRYNSSTRHVPITNKERKQIDREVSTLIDEAEDDLAFYTTRKS